MKLFISKYLLRFLLLSLPVVISSCVREDKTIIPDIETGEEISVRLTVQLPAEVRSLSNVLGTGKENHIESLHLLAFRVDDNDPSLEYYDYRAPATLLGTSGENSNTREYRARVLRKDYKQRFVLIANASQEVSVISDTDKGRLKDDLLCELLYENAGAWHAADAEFVYLPMWGESGQVEIKTQNPAMETIKVIRMVSRVDVELATKEASESFVLSSLHLYNYHDNGRITPDCDPANWNESVKRAINPSLPSSGVLRERGPRKYDAVSSSGAMVIPSVYTFEAPAASMGSPEDATCVVVGGTFGKDTETTYYRVDFINEDEKGNMTGYKHLLRNHLYRINILSVEGSGYTDPDEAFNGRSVNMLVEVKEWDQGDISNIIFDGQYMLGVSQDVFELPKNASDDNLLVVTTDHPDGWIAEITGEDSGWLKVESRTDKGANQKDDLIFSVTENKGKPREAYIKISAGRLSMLVKVTQSDEELLSLDITDLQGEAISELFFLCHHESGDVPEQNYKVTWTPSTVNLAVNTEVHTTVPFHSGIHDTPEAETAVTSNGVQSYRIKPYAITALELDPDTGDEFLEKKSTVTYTLNKNGRILSKSITLHQLHYDLFPHPGPEYTMDGGQYHFTVRANGPWTAEITTNPGGMITTHTLSGTGVKTGEEFYFDIIDDSSGDLAGSTAVVTFTLTGRDGAVVVRTAEIKTAPPGKAVNYGNSNCYMLQPDGDGVLIPVGRANQDGVSRIKGGEKVSVGLIWTDTKNGVGPNSVVRSYSIEGTGPDAHITVFPGSEIGNALIAVYTESGDIAWSWHIWVSGYVPDNEITYTFSGDGRSYTWMDRNLGAVTSERGDPGSFGLTYQWGRKDPFPGLEDYNTTDEKDVWNESATRVPIQREPVLQIANLETAIKNPTHFYYGASASANDWYTNTPSTENRNDELWGNSGGKAIQDPCPQGWRVPKGNPWTDLWTTFTYSTVYNDGSWVRDYGSSELAVGYWPAAGRRKGNDGLFQLGGDKSSLQGYYWSAGYSGNEGRALTFWNNSNERTGKLDQRGFGHYVRCVKE